MCMRKGAYRTPNHWWAIVDKRTGYPLFSMPLFDTRREARVRLHRVLVPAKFKFRVVKVERRRTHSASIMRNGTLVVYWIAFDRAACRPVHLCFLTTCAGYAFDELRRCVRQHEEHNYQVRELIWAEWNT